jgi:hypothetical protein
LERIPARGERLRRFLVGPLTDALESFVGTVVAATSIDDLHEMLKPMLSVEDPVQSSGESGVRLRTELQPTRGAHAFEPDTAKFPEPDTTRIHSLERSDEPTLRFAATMRMSVVLVTQDPSAPSRLRGQLDGNLTIVTVNEIFSLMDAVKGASKQRVLIVFDCRQSPIPPTMMMNVVSRIPESTQVVLWGSQEQVDRQLAPLGRCPERWVRCDQEALAEDVGALIATALARCA